MKLGKNEKKILVLALKNHSKKYNMRPDGICMSILAREIYDNAFGYGNEMLNFAKASLTRSLHSLFKKELLSKAKPIYEKYWIKKNDDEQFGCDGYMSKDLVALEIIEYNDLLGHGFREEISVPKYHELPDCTKNWWILTDKGREIAEKLVSEN